MTLIISLCFLHRKWDREPSTRPGDNCGMLNWSGAFHMRRCDEKLHYICQRPLKQGEPDGNSPKNRPKEGL